MKTLVLIVFIIGVFDFLVCAACCAIDEAKEEEEGDAKEEM